MNETVEYYQNLILEKLYNGFMNNPPNRINNTDITRVFSIIKNNTNFMIAREQLGKDGFLYGKNVNFGNPPFLQITGEGLVYYEKAYIIPCDERKYTLLVSKLLTFLRDLGNNKYELKNYIVDSSNLRIIKVEIPLSDIRDILKNDYNYKINDLQWRMLYFTSLFVSNHIMEINGIGIGNDKLSFFNPNSFCLNGNGHNFLNEVFLIEKFHKIGNIDGRNRVTQLYDDLNVWISKKRWVDVAINMGTIIEYCIDNYVEQKGKEKLQFFTKNNKFIAKVNLNVAMRIRSSLEEKARR